MNRAIKVLLILVVGFLVLWEVIAQGTKTWTKYKLLKEPLPSLTALLPTSLILPVITTLLIVLLGAITVVAIFRSRKVFGLIPIEDLKRHVIVLGPTGSGKTTVAKSIIEKALRSAKDIKVIIIDWKGEYLFPGTTIIRKLTIWDVPGDSPRERALMATEMIREISKDVVEVTPSSSLLLLRILEEEYKRGIPTTERIISALEKNATLAQKEGKFAESNMYMALIRRLYVLLIDEEREAENEINKMSPVIVFDLSHLPSIYLKNLYSIYVIWKTYKEFGSFGGADSLKLLLVAEEAQNYVRPRRVEELPSVAERLVYELRAFGVGVVLVCPDPELIPTPVLRDVGTIIATSPDSLPRFALERYLFRASLEEAEDTLKRLKKSRMVVYYKNQLHFLRRLPRPPKELRLRPKGDRMGVTHPWAGGRSLRAWPILPHRSPGILAPKVIEVKEEVEERPKVIEVKVAEERTEVEPKAVGAEKPKVAEEPLRLEEEELEEEPEIEVKGPEPTITEPVEEKTVEELAVEPEEAKMAEEEESEMIEEEMPMAVEPEPAPKGPPIPSSLPYRGSLCPAGRPHLTPVH
jgi:energy-coupling factor transporter ATP-binding protein EcfA2